ncbi:MAG: hypothetical protein ABH835_01060 [Patescibacteria group bacterium]
MANHDRHPSVRTRMSHGMARHRRKIAQASRTIRNHTSDFCVRQARAYLRKLENGEALLRALERPNGHQASSQTSSARDHPSSSSPSNGRLIPRSVYSLHDVKMAYRRDNHCPHCYSQLNHELRSIFVQTDGQARLVCICRSCGKIFRPFQYCYADAHRASDKWQTCRCGGCNHNSRIQHIDTWDAGVQELIICSCGKAIIPWEPDVINVRTLFRSNSTNTCPYCGERWQTFRDVFETNIGRISLGICRDGCNRVFLPYNTPRF